MSWLRETSALLIRYLMVGVTFVFAGLLYVALSHFRKDSVLVALLSLTVGSVAAHLIWISFENKLERQLAKGYRADAGFDWQLAREFVYIGAEGN